ncbi:MAG: glycosyltransferase, partial [Candidatus Nanopelagicales bacterium]
IDELGGAQKVVRVLADGFGARGHEVLVVGVTPFEPAHPFRGEYETRVLMPQAWPKKSTQTERIRAQLRREAVAGMADILKAQESGRAVIITAQVWAMEILADALAAVSPDVRDRWIVVGQYHGAYAAAASGRDLDRILRAYRTVPVFTALTNEDGTAFTRAGLNNVVTMPNPVAVWPESLAPREPGTSSDRGGTLLYLGRLSPEKGVDVLIDAWSLVADAHPGWKLQIVGDGPDRDRLHAQSVDLAGEDRIEWQETTDDPESVLSGADLLVVPSRTEGLPLVIAEAQAYEVPVVATDCSSGVRQLIGDWGMLSVREDSRALARCLDRAMSDDAWRESVRARARSAMSEYRLPLVMDRWEHLIARAMR